MYVLKTRREIEMMRRAGQLAHDILQRMRAAAVAGVTTGELDEMARAELDRAGAVSGSKNYPNYKPGEGYPGYTCISVDSEIVHGIPGKRVLREGDIVSLDMALSLNGYFADTAVTVPIGAVSPLKQKLLDVTREALVLAIENIRPGRKWSEIARLVQRHVEGNKFNVVREFVGHGVGRTVHEDPQVPNFVDGKKSERLRPGMTLAIEPMVNSGLPGVKILSDGWTVITQDGSLSAHFEHTILITESEPEILTCREKMPSALKAL